MLGTLTETSRNGRSPWRSEGPLRADTVEKVQSAKFGLKIWNLISTIKLLQNQILTPHQMQIQILQVRPAAARHRLFQQHRREAAIGRLLEGHRSVWTDQFRLSALR
jgi:hypothetical protein